MNKFLVSALSVIGTVGVAASSVAIVNNAPGTKDKINISYGTTSIVGNNTSTNKNDQQKLDELTKQLKELQAENTMIKLNLAKEQETVATLTADKTNLEAIKIQNEEQISTLTASNASLQNQVSTLKTEVETKTTKVTELENQVEANETLIAELETSGAASEEEITRLNSENLTLTAQISSLNEDIAAKQEEISTLNSTIDTQTTQISDLQSTNAQHEETIIELDSEIQTKQYEIDDLQNQLAQTDQQVIDLQTQIENYETLLENYAVVTYVIEGIETQVIQEKGSSADYHNSLPLGMVQGWTFDAENIDTVSSDYIVDSNITLYAILGPAEDLTLHYEFTQDDVIADGEDGPFYVTFGTKSDNEGYTRHNGSGTSYVYHKFNTQGKDYYVAKRSNDKCGYIYYNISNVKYMIDGVEHTLDQSVVDGTFGKNNRLINGTSSSLVNDEYSVLLGAPRLSSGVDYNLFTLIICRTEVDDSGTTHYIYENSVYISSFDITLTRSSS